MIMTATLMIVAPSEIRITSPEKRLALLAYILLAKKETRFTRFVVYSKISASA
jgi:hypothetical protein